MRDAKKALGRTNGTGGTNEMGLSVFIVAENTDTEIKIRIRKFDDKKIIKE